MPTWNAQQLKAITTKHKNILVSASAGSGKTTVLIARLIDLVMKDHTPISSILAMTFTEAAASEMKKRLASELHKLLEKSTIDEEKNYIAQQLSDIQNAHISTIHSFCLSILQEHYYTIGLDGERIRHIMDSASQTLYQQQALEAALHIQYEKKEEAFLKLCIQFSSRPENDQQLKALVQSLATMASSKADPDAWLMNCEQIYQDYPTLNELPDPILTMFYDYFQTELTLYKDNLCKIQKRLSHVYPEEIKKLDVVDKKIIAIEPCMVALHKHAYMEFKQAFIAVSHGIVPTPPDKEDAFYIRLRKQTQAQEDHLLGILFDEQRFLSDIKDMQPSIHKLIELCRDYRHAYEQIKRKQQVIDFDDMEHYALSILQANDGVVAKKYREQFVEIMVDEFQDSNDVQNTLVQYICKDNNVFRVGDIKQSIYGFRHAKPSIMKNLIDHKTQHDEIIYLSNNYRSKKMIVDFNNFLFEKLMNIDGFDSTYHEEDNVETGIPEQLSQNVPVIFHAIDHNAINEQEATIYSKSDFKASYIANQIMEIKEQEQRSWKDFVVLVRGNARKDDMKAAFDELNIPYFIDIKYGFYQSNAVQIVLSFLKFCLHPHDDISFIAMALSPLAFLTTEEITDAKLYKQKDDSYYHYFQDHPFQAFSSLEELRKLSYYVSLSEMLNAIYDHHGYYTRYTTMQEKTNLDLLFEKAVQFEEEQIGSIASFLDFIDHIKDAKTAEAIPVGSEEDVVRVMSIHQSKGLQFPVVFLWSNTSQIPIEFKELCISDGDLGIAMKHMQLPNRYVRTTPMRIAIEHKKNKEELEEEMRILYVATTRAQQQMHIVDCVKSLEDYEMPCSMSAIYERNGYTSWILQTFYEQSSDLFKIKAIQQQWPVHKLSKAIEEHKPISQYKNEHKFITFSTASKSKMSDELPKLSLIQNKGALHGSMIHEMIEKVPFPYTSQDIQSYAKQQHFDVTTKDIQSLQALATHDLYQKIIAYEHYHELPFMVQDDHTILHGFIDFLAVSDHDVYIIDFKTDHMFDSNLFIEMYQEQLETYKKAIRMLYPNHKINAYLYSLSMHEMISIKETTY